MLQDSHTKIIKHIYVKYFITRSKVISIQRYSDNATLHFALSHNALSQQSKVIVSKHYRDSPTEPRTTEPRKTEPRKTQPRMD